MLEDQQRVAGNPTLRCLSICTTSNWDLEARLLWRPGDSEFGEIMHEHWEHNKRRSVGMSNPQIDEWYELGRKNGAIGGKLVGAGGGGFLMFYAEDRKRLRQAMAHAGLEEVRFRFEFEGTKVLLS